MSLPGRRWPVLVLVTGLENLCRHPTAGMHGHGEETVRARHGSRGQTWSLLRRRDTAELLVLYFMPGGFLDAKCYQRGFEVELSRRY